MRAADQARDGRGRRPRADRRSGVRGTAPRDCRCAAGQLGLRRASSSRRARDVWYQRVLPLAHNIRTRETVRDPPALVPYDPAWADDARRIINRLKMACGPKALRVDHIGSTAVPGMDAKDVIDVQVTVESLSSRRRTRRRVAERRLPAARGHRRATCRTTDDPSLWRKRIHGAADPGRPANIHVRVDGWPNQQFALLFVDWLSANPGVREDYLAAKRRALGSPDYAEAKEPWFLDAYWRARAWADATGWTPREARQVAGAAAASAGGASGADARRHDVSSAAPHCSVPYSGSSLTRNSRGAMN